MATTKDVATFIRKKLATDRDLAEAVYRESLNASIACQIYEARTKAGLTQRQLAARSSTLPSVIARLEDADYDGQSLAMLQRIGHALGKELTIEFREPCEVGGESTLRGNGRKVGGRRRQKTPKSPVTAKRRR